jgi:predicted transcriptional regulator
MRTTDNLSTRTDTSDAAFVAAPKGAAARLLDALRDSPRTVDELMVDLDMSHSTCSAGINRLMRMGWVVDCGLRAVTRAGRTAIVWRALDTPQPIAHLRPTRKTLAARIDCALRILEANGSKSDIEFVLRGLADA